MAYARFVESNTSIAGDWKNKYGKDGYSIPGTTASLPSYVSITSNTGSLNILSDPIVGSRYLVKPNPSSDRINSVWDDSSSMDLVLSISENNKIVSLYFCPDSEYNFELSVIDNATSSVLYGPEAVSLDSLSGTTQKYLRFECEGSVKFELTSLDANPVGINGLFFDSFTITDPFFPLYLSGGEWRGPTSNNLELFLQGSSSGWGYAKNDIDLFMNAEAGGTGINLFLNAGINAGSMFGSLNLFMGDKGTYNSSSIGLMIFGSASQYEPALLTLTEEQLLELTEEELLLLPMYPAPIFTGLNKTGSIDLYISGEGENEGFFVANSGLNLYMIGPPGIESHLDLFLNASPIQPGSLDLFTFGVTDITSESLDLYLYSVLKSTNSLALFARGYRD